MPPTPTDARSGRSREWAHRDAIWNAALATRDKVVLFAFLDYDRSGRGSELFPSIERVAWQTGLANSTVRQAVDELQRLGILVRCGHVQSKYDPRGRVSKFLFSAEHLPTRPVPSGNSRRQTAPVDAAKTPNSRRLAAPVDAGPNSRPEPAPVDAEQPPDDAGTAAGWQQNSRRMTEQQPPATGADRTYVNVRTERTSERKETGAEAPAFTTSEKPEADPAADEAADVPPFAVYAAMAGVALDAAIREDRDDSPGNVGERLKRLCVAQGKPYGGDIVRRAVDAVLASRDRARDGFTAQYRGVVQRMRGA